MSGRLKRAAAAVAVCLAAAFIRAGAQDSVRKVTGTVVGEDGAPIAGVVINAKKGTPEKTVAYCITGEDGTFVLKWPGDSSPVTLEVVSMMTETVTVSAVPGETLRISVKEKVRTIAEAKVRAPRVSSHGDTLNYNVASYASSDDRSIGEVLKRLPGIKVTSDGAIYYQNTEINKFYVEGLDLLQGRYGIATKNIDPSMVATIQVLENHQPIKVLEGTDIPPNAAINLKLRKSASGAYFLNAQFGAGLPLGLLSNELVGMRFTQKQQNMLIYKQDNAGNDISEEMVSLYDRTINSVSSPFALDMLSVPQIDKKHYLFNNAHMVSANDLRLLRDKMTLTTNINFLADSQEKEGHYRETVIDPVGGDILIAEDISSRYTKRELTGTVTLEKNTKSEYLRNRLDVNAAWNGGDCSVASDSPVSQRAVLPSLNIGNRFSYLKNGARWTSDVTYTVQNDSLRVSPVLLEDLAHIGSSVSQHIRFSQLNANLGYWKSTELTSHLEGHVQLRPFYNRYRYESGFNAGPQIVTADTLSNDLVRNEFGADFTGRLFYNRRKASAQFAASGKYLNVANEWRIPAGEKVRAYLLPSLSGSFEYKTTYMNYRFDAYYSRSVAGIEKDLTGYVMSSYRSFSRNRGVLPQSDIMDIRLRVSYKDILSSFFSSVSAGYSIAGRNTLSRVRYNGILRETTDIKYHNNADNVWAMAELGTDIEAISTTAKLRADVSHGSSVALYQGRVADLSSDNLRVSPSVFAMLGAMGTLSYDALYSLSRSTIDGNRNTPIHYLQQTASVMFVPFKNASLRVSCDHYYNSALSGDKSAWFCNASVRYGHKKAEWILSFSNIFNTREIVSYRYNDFSSYYSSYILRPFEVMLKLRIKLL